MLGLKVWRFGYMFSDWGLGCRVAGGRGYVGDGLGMYRDYGK